MPSYKATNPSGFWSALVITAVTDCHMALEEPGCDTRQVLVPAGDSYRRMRGIEHNVINDSDAKMSFVEVELK